MRLVSTTMFQTPSPVYSRCTPELTPTPTKNELLPALSDDELESCDASSLQGFLSIGAATFGVAAVDEAVGLDVVDEAASLGVVDEAAGLGVVDEAVGLGVVDEAAGLGVVDEAACLGVDDEPAAGGNGMAVTDDEAETDAEPAADVYGAAEVVDAIMVVTDDEPAADGHGASEVVNASDAETLLFAASDAEVFDASDVVDASMAVTDTVAEDDEAAAASDADARQAVIDAMTDGQTAGVILDFDGYCDSDPIFDDTQVYVTSVAVPHTDDASTVAIYESMLIDDESPGTSHIRYQTRLIPTHLQSFILRRSLKYYNYGHDV